MNKNITKPFNELTTEELLSRKTFDCGEVSLNEYLQRTMKNHDNKFIAKSFLYTLENKIVGYYTLSSTEINFQESYTNFLHLKLPPHPVPTILLARLAIDKSHQGKGLGDILLADALQRAKLGSDNVGGVGLVVDALNQNAVNFYSQYGFLSSPINPLRLFLSLK